MSWNWLPGVGSRYEQLSAKEIKEDASNSLQLVTITADGRPLNGSKGGEFDVACATAVVRVDFLQIMLHFLG